MPRLRPLTVGVVCACVALTLGLGWAARRVDQHSNQRILEQQVQQAAVALSSSMPIVQAQLAQVLQVAEDTNGDPQIFRRVVGPVLKKHPEMVGLSLWQAAGGKAHEVATSGGPYTLVSNGQAAAFLSTVKPTGEQPALTQILPGSPQRLGFAEALPGGTQGLVVYGESLFPPNRRITIPKSSPFGDLHLALYLGPKPVESQLLEATTQTPIRGRTSHASLPFGDKSITVVASSTTDLAGGLSASLWWIVLIVGGALAVASGAALEFMARRRALAERLYRHQRDIASTLQHALLPDVPDVPGLEISARYLAGVAGTEVGGDWYDVIRPEEQRVVFFVGDVSGRGLTAATTMGSLRYAIRAYVAQGDSIETVLVRLGGLLDFETDQHFATVLAGEIDLKERRITLASAGHFAPLLITDTDEPRFVVVEGGVQPPVGVAPLAPPMTTSFHMPADGTLLAFTDGVVERKGESIDIGLQRLRDEAVSSPQSLDELLDHLVASLVPHGADDDIVMLAIRWHG
jgi:serine phosphatase RsbU (regulator of sigma subunit)